jgi:thymidylate synthase (FAD)
MAIVSSELKNILNQEFKMLDHGFIRVIDYMGNDSSVVQAARVSYGEGTKKISEDRALIHYLLKNRHDSPFEMCELKVHIKCPFFVARQWMRHRAGHYNETSARYSIVDREYYVPESDQVAYQSKGNKQGRENITEDELSQAFLTKLSLASEAAHASYDYFIEENVAREISRCFLTMNYYTEFYWKVDLRNLMHFIKLRSDIHAQYEIRVYAMQLLEIVKLWVPMTYDAFDNYVLNGVYFSRIEHDLLQKQLHGQEIFFEESGLSKREWDEFVKKCDL